MMNSIHRFDALVRQFVQQFPFWTEPLFMFVTMIGDPIAVLVIAGLIVPLSLYYHQEKLAFSALAIPMTLIIGSIIKVLVARVRPVSEYSHLLRLDTYSFPSGHASGSMIAYGFLAYICYKLLPALFALPATILLGLLPILIGLSRVYFGVHYPSDIIGGWLLGLTVLCVVIFVIRPL